METRTNPFPGLRPFTSDQSHLFFGRTAEIKNLLLRLSANRFVAVVGSSGCGKSSLVRSGAIPTLKQRSKDRNESNWRIATLRPGGEPITNLARAVVESAGLADSRRMVGDGAVSDDGPVEFDEVLRAETTLRRSDTGLADAVRDLGIQSSERLLVVVDQFEELFRFRRNGGTGHATNEAIAFNKLLLSAASQEKHLIYIVLTMRSDFIGDCATLPYLAERINDSQFLVPRLTRNALRDAIVGPVQEDIAPRLVVRLLNEVGEGHDQLPILQHALKRTWEEWDNSRSNGDRIDVTHYDRIGTMENALSKHGQGVYQSLTPGEQKTTERIFKALTDTVSDARGIRRSASVRELCEIVGADESDVKRIVRLFLDANFLTADQVPLSDRSIVDLSHESLMRRWDLLKTWTREESEASETYRDLLHASGRYRDKRGELIWGLELARAVEWRDKNPPTQAQRHDTDYQRAMAFLAESERERDRHEALRRRRETAAARMKYYRRTLGFLSGAFIVVLALLGVVWKQHQAVAASERAAVASEKAAVASEKAAVASERAAVESAEEALLQKGIADSLREVAQNEAAEAMRQKRIADSLRAEAEAQRDSAQAARVAASDSARVAHRGRVLADSLRRDAESLRMLSLARELAVEAPHMENRRELATLLAVSARRFNATYGGYTPNAAIHNGLRQSLKELNPGREPLKSNGTTIATAQRKRLRALELVREAEEVITGGRDGSLVRYNLQDTRSRSVLSPSVLGIVPGGRRIRALAASATQNILAVGCFDGTIFWQNLSPTSPLKPLIGHSSSINCLSVHPSTRFLVSGSRTGEIWLWDPDSLMKPIEKLAGVPRLSSVSSVVFGRNGEQLVAGTTSGALIWNLGVLNKPKLLEEGRDIRAVALSQNNDYLATADFLRNRVKLWDWKQVLEWDGQKPVPIPLAEWGVKRATGLSFSPQGFLASASRDGTVMLLPYHVRRTGSGVRTTEPITISLHEDEIWALGFTRDGDQLVTAGADSYVRASLIDPDSLAREACKWVSKKRNTYIALDEGAEFYLTEGFDPCICADAGDTPVGGTVTEEMRFGETTPSDASLHAQRAIPPAPAHTAAGPARPRSFAVHVGSFRRRDLADREVDNLRKRGFKACAVHTDLGSKGFWFRVYAGDYSTKAAARLARDTILAFPNYDYAQVRPLPSTAAASSETQAISLASHPD